MKRNNILFLLMAAWLAMASDAARAQVPTPVQIGAIAAWDTMQVSQFLTLPYDMGNSTGYVDWWYSGDSVHFSHVIGGVHYPLTGVSTDTLFISQAQNIAVFYMAVASNDDFPAVVDTTILRVTVGTVPRPLITSAMMAGTSPWGSDLQMAYESYGTGVAVNVYKSYDPTFMTGVTLVASISHTLPGSYADNVWIGDTTGYTGRVYVKPVGVNTYGTDSDTLSFKLGNVVSIDSAVINDSSQWGATYRVYVTSSPNGATLTAEGSDDSTFATGVVLEATIVDQQQGSYLLWVFIDQSQPLTLTYARFIYASADGTDTLVTHFTSAAAIIDPWVSTPVESSGGSAWPYLDFDISYNSTDTFPLTTTGIELMPAIDTTAAAVWVSPTDTLLDGVGMPHSFILGPFATGCFRVRSWLTNSHGTYRSFFGDPVGDCSPTGIVEIGDAEKSWHTVKIFDSTGRLVRTATMQDEDLYAKTVSGLAPGAYVFVNEKTGGHIFFVQ